MRSKVVLIIVLLLSIRQSLSTSAAMLIIHFNFGTRSITAYPAFSSRFLNYSYDLSNRRGEVRSAGMGSCALSPSLPVSAPG